MGGQGTDRAVEFALAGARIGNGLHRQDHLPRLASDGFGHQPILLGIGNRGEIQVEEDAVGAEACQFVDDLGMMAPRPGPALQLLDTAIVQSDDDDIAARIMLTEDVPAGAQHVLGRPAEVGHAKRQCGQHGPQQQTKANGLVLSPCRPLCARCLTHSARIAHKG